ncbi:MAG: hypothetical protein RID09_27815 [Coleofasciculus sp. G1-WW12-02]|uniref:hypothetical protein n=1 Tax=Coleofasciculus sp. G1-WW12-02 TaxID=3068483 RepID=UPI0033012E6D
MQNPWDVWINNRKPIDICYQIKDTLVKTSWLSIFDKDTSYEDNLNPTSEDNNKITPLMTTKYIDSRGGKSEAFKAPRTSRQYQIKYQIKLLEYTLDFYQQLQVQIENYLKSRIKNNNVVIELALPYIR